MKSEEKIAAQYKEYFDLASECELITDRLAEELNAKNIPFEKFTKLQFYLSGGFWKANGHLRSILLLCKHGFVHDASMILRSLLEISTDSHFITSNDKSEEMLSLALLEDDKRTHRELKLLVKRNPNEQNVIIDQIEVYSKKISENKISKVEITDQFGKTFILKPNNLHWSGLSLSHRVKYLDASYADGVKLFNHSIHFSTNSVGDFVEISTMVFGPKDNTDDIPFLLCFSTVLFAEVCDCLAQKFELESLNEIRILKKKAKEKKFPI